jgi:hypothetical protein
VEQPAAGHQVLRRRLDVQDALTGGHPLGVTVGDRAAAAQRVLVIHDPVDHVGHRLEPAVGVPGGPFRLARRIVDLAHLVEVDERVELVHRHAGEGPAHREALALVAARRGGEPPNRTIGRRGRVELRHARENKNVVDCDSWHLRPS